MTSLPTAVSRLRARRTQLLSADGLRRARRIALPIALLALVIGLSFVAVRGESSATLPVDVHVVSTTDPMHLGATTQATVTLTNHGDNDVRPRFSLSWLPYPYYWRIVSGPLVLHPGETATYEIEAPDSLASPHNGERFQIRVNDATSITYAISAPITNGRTVLPITNPNLLMWTQQDPSSGLLSPAGWNIYSRTDDDDLTSIEPTSVLGVNAAYFHVVQSGQPDPGLWTHTGLTQDIPFPSTPLDVRVLSNVRYQAITGSGDHEYDLPNGQHIKVYDVPLGQWTTRTIDVAELYRHLNWAQPRRVNLKLFMGASSFTRADIDGYVAGIGLHESAAASVPGG
jgi:hypothetical protein